MPDDGNSASKEVFETYFSMFHNCNKFVSTMAHFVSRSYGPDSFKMEFPTSFPKDQREFHNTLLEFFKPSTLSTRISSTKSGVRVASYCQNLVAMKFGFRQFFPKSFFAKEQSVFLASDEPHKQWYQKCLKFYTKKFTHMNPFELSLSFHCAKEFEDQCFAYYRGEIDPLFMVQILTYSFFVYATPDKEK